MIKNTYICHLGNQTSRRIQHVGFIVKTVCCSKNKFSRDLGSPGSRQLLQLQWFSKIFKILDPPCWFFPSFIWFLELCCFFATILNFFLSLNLGKLSPSFRKLDDLNLPLSSQSFWLWSFLFFYVDDFVLALSEVS